MYITLKEAIKITFHLFSQSLQNTEESGQQHKYKSNSLRFRYNAISDLEYFCSTLEHFLENPLDLEWLDLSFNDISTIDEVIFSTIILKCAVPENIHTPPTEGFCFPLPLPPGNSSLFSYISSKNLAFKTPLPLGISNDLPWGGYGLFLELHNYYFPFHCNLKF